MKLESEQIDEELYIQMQHSLNQESFENEDWIDVYGIAGQYYQVSTLGRFKAKTDIIYNGRSCRFHRYLDTVWHQNDIIEQYYNSVYVTINLYIPGITSKENEYSCQYSHIIIYKSFINDDFDSLKYNVDHINGIKFDNRICNLQLLSIADNSKKSYINDESGRWTNRKSSVLCVETGKIYKHIQDAVADTGVSDAALAHVIVSGTKAGGYHWEYTDKDKQQNAENKRPEKRVGISTQSTWVKCLETNDIMLCSDMARICGRNRSDLIYEAIDYHNGYCNVFDKHFEFVNEEDIDFMSDKIQNYIKNIYYRKDRLVHNITDDIYFMSLKQAGKYYGVSSSTIKYSIEHNKPLFHKYVFERIGD